MNVKAIVWSTLIPSMDPIRVENCFNEQKVIHLNSAYPLGKPTDKLQEGSPKRMSAFIDHVKSHISKYADDGYVLVVTCPMTYLPMIGATLHEDAGDGVLFINYTDFVIADDDITNSHMEFTERVHSCTDNIHRVPYDGIPTLLQGYEMAYRQINHTLVKNAEAAAAFIAEKAKVVKTGKTSTKVLCLDMCGNHPKSDFAQIVTEIKLLGVNVLVMPTPSPSYVHDYITSLDTIAKTIENPAEDTLFIVNGNTHLLHTIALINEDMVKLSTVTCGSYQGYPEKDRSLNESRNYAITIYKHLFIENEAAAPEEPKPEEPVLLSREASLNKLSEIEKLIANGKCDPNAIDMKGICDSFGECFAWIFEPDQAIDVCQDVIKSLMLKGHGKNLWSKARIEYLTKMMLAAYDKYRKILTDRGLI